MKERDHCGKKIKLRQQVLVSGECDRERVRKELKERVRPCLRVRKSVCVSVCVNEREKECKKTVCVCVCECEGENKRKRMRAMEIVLESVRVKL